MKGDIVAYYDDYTKMWHFGRRDWCEKNNHKNLILVRSEEWAKYNLLDNSKRTNK